LRADLLELLMLNVRVAEERRGDYFAQVAACRLGERRLQELCASYGAELLDSAFGEIIARTEARMRSALLAIPPGSYSFEDFMDDDEGCSGRRAIRVRIEASGERLLVDFTGSSPQVNGNINAPLNATQSAVYYALKALFDPDVPNNEGVMNAVEIVAPRGSIVNCAFPGAVAARAHTCQRIVDVILGALSDALPDRSVGAANGANTTIVISGVDPRTGDQYVYLETLGGGFGGRATKDGKDAVQVHITNTSNLPVEAIEMEYPLVVEAYELVPDSGGAGKFRGGLGLRRMITPVGHVAAFSGHGERFQYRPWGVFGAGAGQVGRFAIIDSDGSRKALSSKPTSIAIAPSQTIMVETPGAGGYGNPRDRSGMALRADFVSGKFSASYISKQYGVDLNAIGPEAQSGRAGRCSRDDS